MGAFDPTVTLNNNQNGSILKARSPISLAISTSNGDGVIITVNKIEMFIWNGLKSAKPSTATYTIDIPNSSFDLGDIIRFDLKDYVKTFLENDKFPYNNNDAAWFDIKYTYNYISDGSSESYILNLSFIVANGFATYKNDDKESEMLYLPSDIYIPEGRTYPITIIDKGVIGSRNFNNILISYDNNTTATYTLPAVPADPESGDLFLVYNVILPVGVNSAVLTTKFDAATIATHNFYETPQKKYNFYSVGYYDKNGAISYIWTGGNTTTKSSFVRDSYSPILNFNINNQYDETKGSNKLFNVNGISELELNTDFVPESYNILIKELMLTEYAFLKDEDEDSIDGISIYEYLTEEGFTLASTTCTTNEIDELGGNIKQFDVKDTVYTYVIYPIVPINNQITYKTQITDRLINYNLTFQRAYNDINNIF